MRAVDGRNGEKLFLKLFHSCDACDVHFKYPLSLHFHLKSREHIDMIGRSRDTVKWSCPICKVEGRSRTFDKAHDFEKHLRSKPHKKEFRKKFGISIPESTEPEK